MPGFELQRCAVQCKRCGGALFPVTAPETCLPEVWQFGEPVGWLARSLGDGFSWVRQGDLPLLLRARLLARRPMVWGMIAWLFLGLVLLRFWLL